MRYNGFVATALNKADDVRESPAERDRLANILPNDAKGNMFDLTPRPRAIRGLFVRI
jgi:hypothetical protein